MEHIPYRGTAPALLDVVAGRVAMNFSSPPPAIPQVKEGKLRAIAVTGDKRIAAQSFVLAAGCWSPALLETLGPHVTLPIQPVKGYSITVDTSG